MLLWEEMLVNKKLIIRVPETSTQYSLRDSRQLRWTSCSSPSIIPSSKYCITE